MIENVKKLWNWLSGFDHLFFIFILICIVGSLFLSLAKRSVDECGRPWGIDSWAFTSEYFCPQDEK